MKHVKRCLAVVLSFAMVIGLIPTSMMGTVKAAGTGLLAEYIFEDNDATDRVIEDATGNGYDATLEGNGAKVANGTLTLPGGAAGSNAAYVSIPGELFENQDTLTISLWLKNGTGRGNYAAMYFGTPTTHIGGGTATAPLNYWMLNPSNIDTGYFKSVWTDGDNASTPWRTETLVSATVTSADWGLYTTVITPTNITGYYNGMKVSNSSKSTTTSEFGTGLVAYIGRSAYNDMFYKGGVYGVRVYGKALTAGEIAEEYNRNMPPELGGPGGKELLADFKFNSDFTISDASGNGYKATLKGNNAATANGILTLPGGEKTSNAAYVELPGSLFEKRNTLTITTWLKNETGTGNYAAMYFGTKSQYLGGGTATAPLNYWLLNPSNGGGLYKSVWTNANDTSKPYETEVGPAASKNGAASVKTDAQWRMYTTVITEGSITAYYDGELVNSVAKTKKTSDFGTGLVASIGRSAYQDMFYKGSVYGVRVYGNALTQQEIWQDYYDNMPSELNRNTVIDTALENAKNSLTLDSKVTKDLSLPTEGAKGSVISWSSSDPNVISNKGKVTVPASGSASVTMTATISIAGKSVTKDIPVTVSSESGSGSGSDDAYGYIMAYTNSSEKAELGNSLHLAASRDGITYTALNSNTGICFANNKGGTKASNPNSLQDVCIFRKIDGTYGMIARNPANKQFLYVYDSKNLVDFTNERSFWVMAYDITGGVSVSINKDNASYHVLYKSGDQPYAFDTTNFTHETISGHKKTAAVKQEISSDCHIPKGAVVGNVLSVSKSEYERVVNRLDDVRNTGVQAPKIGVRTGQTTDVASLLPKTVVTEYSDGSTANKKVVWDSDSIKKVDLSKEGVYEVTGTVQQKQYPNPFIGQRADPCILKGNDGYYYFTASYPMVGASDRNGYDKITLRRSKTIEGLATAQEITIWDCDDSSSEHRYVWAPEIRLVNNKYYVFYTSSVESNSVWGIRPHVLQCTNASNIMSPSSWQAKGVMQKRANDTSNPFSGFSLDMTVFENHGRWWVLWAQTDGFSSIFIAEVYPDEPWKCKSNAVKISVPEYAWERQVENVNEGPSVIKRDGKIYVAFSASGTGSEYCIGLLSADELDANGKSKDLWSSSVWTKQSYPVLTSSDVPGEYGPGHNSFTVDEDGNDIFVYHARGETCYKKKCQWAKDNSLYDPCRDARLKRVHWASDGTPILKMSYKEEVAEKYKKVTATINVNASGAAVVKETGVTLDKTDLNLIVGEGEMLTATVLPSNATDKTITWATDNREVATVAKGSVTARGAGTATITATTASGQKATCTVKVTHEGVEGLSENIIYFIDSGVGNWNELRQSSGSYEEAKQVANLRNDTPDKLYQEGSWGFVNPVDSDGNYVRAESHTNAKDSLYANGWWAQKDKTCEYIIPLENGSYKATGYFQEWWGGQNRNIDFYAEYTDDSGQKKTTEVKSKALGAEGAKWAPEIEFEITGVAGKTDVHFYAAKKAGTGNDPCISGLVIESIPQDEEALLEAKRAEAREALEDVTVSVSGNGNNGALEMHVDDTEQITIHYPDGMRDKVQAAQMQLVTSFESTNSNVVRVDNDGRLRGVAAGNAEITATVAIGSSIQDQKSFTLNVVVIEASATVVPVTGITLNKTDITLKADQSETLIATVLPENATNKKISWKSSDPDVASVTNNGTVTAKAAGEAIITATAGDDKTATCRVVVDNVPVTGITLDESNLTLEEGESKKLIGTVLPLNATDKTISWASSNSDVASVSDGIVTAKAAGNTIITATAGDNKTATCEVVVETVPVQSVTLNESDITLKVGDSRQLTRTILPSNATNKTVTWESSDSNVASVANDGLVEAKAAGTTTITVTAEGNKTATCNVVVETVPVERIVLDDENITLEVGHFETLVATIKPANATDKTVSWASSNSDVADVVNGIVEAKAVGTATITATAGDNKTATCEVEVKEATVPVIRVESISLSQSEMTLKVGGSRLLTAEILPENATNKKITWVSLNERVASVEDGTVTALAAGKATITAFAGNKAATCEVVVERATPTVISVSSIILDKSELTLNLGDNKQLEATVLPSNATNRTITWESSNPTVASVDGGMVTALTAGKTTITAIAGDKISTCEVEVKQGVTLRPTVSQKEDGSFTVEVSEFTTDKKTEVGIDIPVSLAESIKNYPGKAVAISVDIPDSMKNNEMIDWTSITLPKEVLEAAKIAEKDLVITVNGDSSYRWVFTAEELKSSTIAAENLLVEKDSAKDDEVKKTLNADEEGMVFTVARQEKGTAAPGSVSVDTAGMNWKPGDVVNLSWYNYETKLLEPAGTYTLDADGKVTISGPKVGTTYVLWRKIPEQKPDVTDVTDVILNKTSLELTAGEVEKLQATVQPENATDKTVTWTSDNQGVATVAQDGTVTAVVAGTANITVTTANGIIKTCTVTVKEQPPTAIRVTKLKLNVKKLTLGGGEKFTLKVTITPKNATNKKVTWTSSNKKAATVNTKGVVTAKKVKKPAKTTITAKVDGKKITCTVTVKPAPKKIALNAKSKTLKKGKTFQVKVKKYTPKNAASYKLTYSVDKKGKKVVTVDKKGKIKAKKKGKATITVKTFNKKKATIKITVK